MKETIDKIMQLIKDCMEGDPRTPAEVIREEVYDILVEVLNPQEIKLGDKVKDTITGFEGTAIARTQHIHGCTQIDVVPMVDDEGKVMETIAIDEPQLEVIEDNGVPEAEPRHGGNREKPRGRK